MNKMLTSKDLVEELPMTGAELWRGSGERERGGEREALLGEQVLSEELVFSSF